MEQTAPDFTKLADPDLIAERRHMREKLAGLPPSHRDRARLAATLDALTRELDSRARAAWRAPAPQDPAA
jgi:hypothetical protein